MKFTTFIPLLLYQPNLEFATLSFVEGIYKKYVAIAKEKHPDMFLKDSYPPHSMRHTTACHLIEAGVDIVTIKKHPWTCICTDNTDLCRNVAGFC